MPTTIMIGQLPLIIEGDENIGPIASYSGISAGQASNPKDGEAAPVEVISNASDDENPNEEPNHKSDSENHDDNPDEGPSGSGRKRKRYHRHTLHQIHEMESFFKVCPHPDEKQRKQLGRDLGLEPLQVKFWFQNKRTQMKTHLERANNGRLKAENDKLRAENIKFREVLTKACCLSCGNPQAMADISLDENQLREENSRLKEEIARMTDVVTKYVGKPHADDNFASSSANPSSSVNAEMVVALGGGQPNIADQEFIVDDEFLRTLTRPIDIDKPVAIELVISAMEELIKLADVEFPLWVANIDNRTYSLNEDPYYNMFPKAIGLKPPGFNVEASKGYDVVSMNHTNLVEVFMDLDKWNAVFASIVSRASVLDVISGGSEPGNFDGTLLMISAEYQVLTPTIPTRESVFLRYCKQIGEGTWGIVDVNFDNMFSSGPLAKCQRRPSGCIIQEMPNGCSKIIWIEHVQVQDEGFDYLGKPFVESNLAFGAQRWLCVLARQCERLTSAIVTNISPNDINDTVLMNPEGRKNILKLSERMVLNFCGVVTSSSAYGWLNLSESGNNQTRIMTKKSENEPGRPTGVVLSATTSFWLPVSHRLVFDYLRDETARIQWDILVNHGNIQEMVHITNGIEAGNCVSLLRGTNASQADVLILQECSTHPTGSFIVYAPVDDLSINLLLAGGNPELVTILPSGFTVYPSGPTNLSIPVEGMQGGTYLEVGSILTVAFQVLVNSTPASNISIPSVSIISNLLESTCQKIRAAFTPQST